MNCLYHSRLNSPLCTSKGKHSQGKPPNRRPRLSYPRSSWLSGSNSTQLSSWCIYIMFNAALSIFVRQPNCFEISYILWIPKVNYTVGCEQTEPNTPTNTHTWFAQINSSSVCCLIITFLFHWLFPCFISTGGEKVPSLHHWATY